MPAYSNPPLSYQDKVRHLYRKAARKKESDGPYFERLIMPDAKVRHVGGPLGSESHRVLVTATDGTEIAVSFADRCAADS